MWPLVLWPVFSGWLPWLVWAGFCVSRDLGGLLTLGLELWSCVSSEWICLSSGYRLVQVGWSLLGSRWCSLWHGELEGSFM